MTRAEGPNRCGIPAAATRHRGVEEMRARCKLARRNRPLLGRTERRYRTMRPDQATCRSDRSNRKQDCQRSTSIETDRTRRRSCVSGFCGAAAGFSNGPRVQREISTAPTEHERTDHARRRRHHPQQVGCEQHDAGIDPPAAKRLQQCITKQIRMNAGRPS